MDDPLAVSTVLITFGLTKFLIWRLQRQTSVCTVVNIYLLLCEVFDTLTSKMTFVTFCRRVICCIFGNVTCWQLAVSLITDCLPKVIFFSPQIFQIFRFWHFKYWQLYVWSLLPKNFQLIFQNNGSVAICSVQMCHRK